VRQQRIILFDSMIPPSNGNARVPIAKTEKRGLQAERLANLVEIPLKRRHRLGWYSKSGTTSEHGNPLDCLEKVKAALLFVVHALAIYSDQEASV